MSTSECPLLINFVDILDFMRNALESKIFFLRFLSQIKGLPNIETDTRNLKCSPWDLRGESLPAQDPTQTTGWSMEDASLSRWPGGYLLQTVEAQVYEVAGVHLYFPDTVGIVGVVSRVEWAGKVPTGTE